MKYYTVEVSAENRDQADLIVNALIERKLTTGGQFIETPARFLWNGEVIDMNYVTISMFTIEPNKHKIIEIVEEYSQEEVPMIRFYEFEGNKQFLNWILETLDD